MVNYIIKKNFRIFYIKINRDAFFTLVRLRFVRASLLSVALRAQRASVRSTRTPHRLRTRNRSSLFRCFPPWCPASTPAPSEGTHATPFVSPHDCGFVRVPIFTVARRRRPDLPPSSPPPRASLHVTAQS